MATSHQAEYHLSAIEAFELGWSIIPAGDDKRPLIPWKQYQNRVPTADEFAAWQRLHPKAWALITGALNRRVTLDFDGQAGRQTILKLGLDAHRVTPSAGFHVDFAHPGWTVPTLNGKTKSELGDKWPGLDIRADGGYVLFTGRTVNGEYHWLRDPRQDPDAVTALPEKLRADLSLLHPPRPAAAPPPKRNTSQSRRVDAARLIRMALERTPSEGRNNAGFWLAVQLRDNGFDFEGATAAMLEYCSRVPECNTKGQQEPYTVEDAMATLRQAFRQPPREPWEVRGSRNAGDQSQRAEACNTTAQAQTTKTIATAEDDLALRFVDRYERELRYTAAWHKWHHWNGPRWQEDISLKVPDLVRKLCREAAQSNPKAERVLKSNRTVGAVVTLASCEQRIAMFPESWDSDKWLLNTPTGLVDLRTGSLRTHDAAQKITKITAVGPAGDCPLWKNHIEVVTAGRKELADYLQRWAGYALTGQTNEEALAFFYGTGQNGKGTFITTLQLILGDYARSAATRTFMVSKTEQHPTDLAGLKGARLVVASEVKGGSRWDDERIKLLTGGDVVSARFMRGDFFDYVPQFKPWIHGNEKPSLRQVDVAMRRRLHLVPFTVRIPKPDKNFKEGLCPEWPGILRWAVEGCLAWQRTGLDPPSAVVSATEQYFAEQDTLGRWLDERCNLDPNAEESTTAAYEDWRRWTERVREYTGSQKAFTQGLQEKGFKTHKAGTMFFIGFQLKA